MKHHPLATQVRVERLNARVAQLEREKERLDYERQMAVMNRDLYAKLDTVMLAPSPEFAHLSSSLVRELAGLGAPVEKLVPKPVIAPLLERFGRPLAKEAAARPKRSRSR